VSGPLLDRIDLHVEVPPVTAADLALPPPAEGTAEAAARVAAARAAQVERAAEDGASTINARLEGAALETIASPDEAGRALLTRAAETMGLSARAWTRTLRLARTIADLDGSTAVRRLHVAEALIYRPSAAPERPVGAMVGATTFGRATHS
jgi:magnesium chelatase family protein